MKKLLYIILFFAVSISLTSCSTKLSIHDSDLSVVVEETDNPDWKFGDGEECYDIGINNIGIPIFKDPDAAFDQFVIDHAEGIKLIRDKYRLSQISKKHWFRYYLYAWQLGTDDQDKIQKALKVDSFLSFYKNSFPEEWWEEFA